MRSRRTFLIGTATAATLSLSGCAGILEEDDEDDSEEPTTDPVSSPSGDSTSGSSDDSGGTDTTSDTGSDTGSNTGSNQQQTSRENILDTRVSVSEDRYQYWSWDLNRQATLEYSFTVRDGPDIDVFVVDDQELREFENGNRFRTYMHNSGVSGGDSGRLGSGTYYVVVDNTDAGSVAPPTNFDDDVVDVEIEVFLEG